MFTWELKPIADTGYKYESDEGCLSLFTTANPDYWIAIKPSGRKIIAFSPEGSIRALRQSHIEMLDYIFRLTYKSKTKLHPERHFHKPIQ